MRVAVVGLGSVGGALAAALHRGGAQVSALARGATLAAVDRDGLVLRQGGEQRRHRISVSDDATRLGAQDVVVLAVKAPALAAAVRDAQALLGSDTHVVTALNGVPWWFLQGGFGGPVAGRTLRSVDPDGVLTATLPAERVVGAVVHFSAGTPEPGTVHRASGNTVVLGDAIGGSGPGTRDLVATLRAGGLDADATERIQRDVWWKLWGNMTMNPISLLTGATTDAILSDDLAVEMVDAVMREARSLGGVIGAPIDAEPADRHTVTRSLGAMRTSMLQDADAGRPVELDTLLGAAVELGELTGVPTPCTRMLYGLARVRARAGGLYPAANFGGTA